MQLTIDIRLQEPRNALVRQYQKLFEMEGLSLLLTDSALKSIAQRAIKRKSGARGLRATMEDCLLDVMSELPSIGNVKECIIGEEVISKRGQPILIYQPSKLLA